jgi:hypothetical protein
MRARALIGLTCLVLVSGCVVGCSKATDSKVEAAKVDRSKIDDEVSQSQKGDNSTATGGK